MEVQKFIALIILYYVFVSLLVVHKCYIRTDETVSFVDVDQGDAILIGTKKCNYVLVDGGANYNSDYFLFRQLGFLGCSRLKVIILTHPHKDHSFGLKRILTRCPETLVLGPHNHLSAKNFTSISETNHFSINQTYLHVFWPPKGYISSNLNNESVVLGGKFSDGRSFLLPGDIEMPVYANVPVQDLKSFFGCCITYYKLSHHGAKNGHRLELLHTFKIGTAIVSVGRNTYGHPSSSVLQDFNTLKIPVLRTDVVGDIKL